MEKALQKTEAGFILVAVLIFTAALLILGSALVAYSTSEKRIAAYHRHDSALYYITEAGLEAGHAVIGNNFEHRDGFGGAMGEGAYTVNFVFPGADGDLGRHQRKVVSTGVLGGDTLSLELICGVDPIYGQALVVSEALKLSGCTVDGDVHVNGSLSVEGVNTLAAGAGLTCADRQKISFGEGAVLWVKERSYSGGQRLPAAWESGPMALPSLDLLRFEQERSSFDPVDSGAWPPLPGCYRGGAREIQVNGILVIDPGSDRVEYAGDLIVWGDCTITGFFRFGGRMIVFGDLEIISGPETPVYLNGLVVAAGAVCIHGNLSPECSDHELALVAGGEIAFNGVDPGQERFGGGTLFLFSDGATVRIGDPDNPRFDLYGSIVAGRAELYQCHLHHDSGVFMGNPDLPGNRVVVEEWLKP